ncbi:hypothetical protein Tco_1233159, partial [Tanacetum coccineum]
SCVVGLNFLSILSDVGAGTSGESSVAGTAGVVAIVGV